MLHRYTIYILVLLMGWTSVLFSQSTNCNPAAVDTSDYVGTAFFNYGSRERTQSQKYVSAAALGQTFIGYSDDGVYNTDLGFYARYLLPPFALKVRATQGDLLDRIQLSWEIDDLGPSPNEGFNIYRDGIFLAAVGSNIRNYNDFNVIAGAAYMYSVRGLNSFGEGNPSYALGFQVPNGVVTGLVKTQNGSPVPNAVVTLTPMQGFSAKFNAMDQALSSVQGDSTFVSMDHDWTMTYWLKTDSASQNAPVISVGEIPLYIRAVTSTSGHEGIEVAQSPTSTPFLSALFVDSLKNNWTHVSLSFEEATSVMRIYVNGKLLAQSLFNNVISNPEVFFKIGNNDTLGGWSGKMDELRIYSALLNELDFPEIMHGTASSQTENLSYYWKMDEELGDKSYDIMNRVKLYFCGATFDKSRPPVRTAGKTNNEGYYRIESASYGTGTTFLAEPMKSFYLHKSIKLSRANNSNISIPNFSIPKKSTIELWVNNAGAVGPQTILSKKSTDNDFRIFLDPSGLDQEIKISLNGSTHAFGNLGTGFQHLALTLDSTTSEVQLFKNGNSLGSHSFSGTLGNLAEGDHPWRLGVHDNGVLTDYYNGLIDEFAVYDTILTPIKINEHFLNSRDMQEGGLFVYFPMDEGIGDRISNVGSRFMDFGTLENGTWSSFAANQIEEPHVFTPKTRQVTLNPSVTSVDQVDFTDRSTIGVSGFIRYKDTDCFVPNVEILVNDAPFNPRIFTDSTGKFVIDFDPGYTAKLTPKFEDHTFVPAFWQVTNVINPIAGILFNDGRTRTISGQVAGGLCKKSIIETDEYAQVKLRSVDGCYEKLVTIDNQEGTFEIPNLPAIERMTVAIIHSNPFINTALNDLGASTVDLSKRDTTLEFLYFADPQIEIVSGLETYYQSCSQIILDQYERKELGIKLKEQYVATLTDDGVCYIDSANFRIINGFGDETKDTTMSNGFLLYKYIVGKPNPSPPYLKTLQIVSTTLEGNNGEFTAQAIVTGIYNKLPTFTTQLPETPSIILHDPPGDGSYAFIEKGQKVCEKISMKLENTTGGGIQTIIDLGPDIKVPIFFGIPDVEFEMNIGPDFTITNKIKKTSTNSLEVCKTFNQRFSTSEDDVVVGSQGGDMFVGGGLNINFGYADIVFFDSTACQAFDSLSVVIQPGQYATTFMYSEFHINNAVIPHLENLLATALDTSEQNRFQESISRWNTIVSQNNERKKKAGVTKNISFDAGVSYEYSETIDSIRSASTSEGSIFNFDFNLNVIIKGNGIGGGVVIKANVENVSENSTDNNSENGITTGYVFKDNDPLDAFSVDIAIDSVYKTPIFKINAGQSSCPWEPGTANRERPNLQIAEGSQPTAVDVPANSPAVFKLRLGNLSATNEDWTYAFTSIAENNPHGAVIKLNGQPLNYYQKYIIPYGTSQLVTLTVDKGPIEYQYDSLLVALVSECEHERNLALSLPIDRDENFFSPIYLSAYFIRPCSEIKINHPEQNWVIFPDPLTPGPDIIKPVTVSGYNKDPNFKLVRMQYRKTDGDGRWINFPGVFEKYNPKWAGIDTLQMPYDTLDKRNYDIFDWDTNGFDDGNYEVRALTVCTGDAFDKPGYSEIIKGRIDRTPPALVGVPQPSDGVYHVGDEISFTFNQPINCQKFIAQQVNSASLKNSATNSVISIMPSCVGNKIVLTPDFVNSQFENKILRAELYNIEDLIGNKNPHLEWEFYVDRNELAWLTDSIEVVKFVDETKTISAKIHNRGGYPVPFTIINVPDWVHVYPDRGTLVANEIEEIFFTVDQDLDLGEIDGEITLKTETGINPFFMGGEEPLNIKVKNLCRPEKWVLNPSGFNTADYSFSMNFIVQLDIEGTMSLDKNDLVGAYVDGQLRGIAKVEYQASLNKYMAFLTVYSNTNTGEQIKFQIWDASDCKLYAYALETFTFLADNIEGTLSNCVVLHTNTTLLRKIFIHSGWNWISMNLDLVPNDINSALSSLSSPTGALIKGQTQFSAYSNMAASWIGPLMSLVPTSLYQYNSLVKDSISIIGNYLDPTTTNITLSSGWNWIGYIPTQSLKINDALATVNATNGDIIKSQLNFAQYLSGVGWVGNLKSLNAPNGYLLKLANPGILTYPDPLNFRNDIISGSRNPIVPEYHGLTEINSIPKEEMPFENWQVDPTKFEYSMNAIAIVLENENTNNLLHDGDEVAAFVNGELRGSGKALYIPALNSFTIFMTIYANTDGEKLSFKYFDSSSNQEFSLIEKIDFRINSIIGQVDTPKELHINSTTSSVNDVDKFKLEFYPNPFSSILKIQFTASTSQNIKLRIKDVYGKLIETKEIKSNTGLNHIDWKPNVDLNGGTYFITLESSESATTRKVLFIK